jgi:hypothetical protein
MKINTRRPFGDEHVEVTVVICDTKIKIGILDREELYDLACSLMSGIEDLLDVEDVRRLISIRAKEAM